MFRAGLEEPSDLEYEYRSTRLLRLTCVRLSETAADFSQQPGPTRYFVIISLLLLSW